ncbi:hypothetical protein D3C83_75780 [compost metagenome]
MKLSGQLLRFRKGPVDNLYTLCPVGIKMFRRQFAHFARTDQKNRFILKGVKHFLAQFHGNITDGYGILSDLGF